MKIKKDVLVISTPEKELKAFNFPHLSRTVFAASFEEAKKIILNEK